MTTLFAQLIFLFVLLLKSYSVAAIPDTKEIDEDWYQVEIIVFQNKDGGEFLIDTPATGAPAFEVEEFYSLVQTTTLSPLQILEVEKSTLSILPEYQALKRSRDYKPMIISGWKMYLPAEKDELPIKITGGEIFNGNPQLDGFVKIKRSRYLHLYADLALTNYVEVDKNTPFNYLESLINSSPGANASQPAMNTNNNPTYNTSNHSAAGSMPVNPNEVAPYYTTIQETPTNPFTPTEQSHTHIAKDHQRLTEGRRLRSGELHYLDNPTLGILVRINQTVAPDPIALPIEPSIDSPALPESDKATTPEKKKLELIR